MIEQGITSGETLSIASGATVTFRETWKPQSQLRFLGGEVLVQYRARRPNIWRRFWYWFLLGWTWENL